MQVGSKNVSVFINGPVLYNGFCTAMYFYQLSKAAVQEKYLQVKTPARHILVKIHQVWIMVYIFKMRYPFIMFAEQFCKRGFAGSYIPGYGDVFWFLCFCHNSFALRFAYRVL